MLIKVTSRFSTLRIRNKQLENLKFKLFSKSKKKSLNCFTINTYHHQSKQSNTSSPKAVIIGPHQDVHETAGGSSGSGIRKASLSTTQQQSHYNGNKTSIQILIDRIKMIIILMMI